MSFFLSRQRKRKLKKKPDSSLEYENILREVILRDKKFARRLKKKNLAESKTVLLLWLHTTLIGCQLAVPHNVVLSIITLIYREGHRRRRVYWQKLLLKSLPRRLRAVVIN